jgi:diguanylate cyclase
MQNRPDPWPRRFTLYGTVYLLLFYYVLFWVRNCRILYFISGLFGILVGAEYIMALLKGEISLPRWVRGTLLVIPAGFMANSVFILFVILSGRPFCVTELTLTHYFNFSLELGWMLLWEAVILILDGSRLQNTLSRQNRELHHKASTDELTGLKNRLLLDTQLAAERELALRYNLPLSLILIDVDFFKIINDEHGHSTGDQVLKTIATLCRESLRITDHIYRWGGEEFLIITPHTDRASAVHLAEKLRVLVSGTCFDPVGAVTISCGVAALSPNEDTQDWFKRVDEALYRAKNEGRNRVAVSSAPPFPGFASQNANLLRWQKNWESGHPLIDAEHKELVGLANRLLGISLSLGITNELGPALKDFMDHSAVHFTNEEGALEQCGYPEVEEHRRLHLQVISQGEKMVTLFQEGKLPFPEVFNFLVNQVLMDHLLGEDTKFFPWTRQEFP